MITLLVGENSFERERALQAIIHDYEGEVERLDGSELAVHDLPNVFTGATLFSDNRLIVVRHVSDNAAVWQQLAEWLPRGNDDTHVVLVEQKPDKRTITYKQLKKYATVLEFHPWTDRDHHVAIKWVIEEAKRMKLTITRPLAAQLVERVGLDPWQLFHGLEKLSLVDTLTADTLSSVIESSPSENVFAVFEAALRGDTQRLRDMLATLSLSEDPYRLFGLLAGQAFQLAALAVSSSTPSEVAKDVGAHPYVLSKLAPYAAHGGRAGARTIICAFSDADNDMKSSAIDPWLLIERALMHVALATK